MASSLIHLSAARRILEQIPIPDPERFRLGELLPDTAKDVQHSPKILHYKKVDPQSQVRIFDLAKFRQDFGDHLGDSLYLGYYCHLIQDAIFRWFIFSYKHLQTTVPAWDAETVQKLYHDYSLQNHPLIDHYQITVPAAIDLSDEPISRIQPLDVSRFLEGIREYFVTPAPEPPEPYMYTLEDTEEFLDMACEACLEEIRCLHGGVPRLTGHEWEYQH